jgi:hypothetical protein
MQTGRILTVLKCDQYDAITDDNVRMCCDVIALLVRELDSIWIQLLPLYPFCVFHCLGCSSLSMRGHAITIADVMACDYDDAKFLMTCVWNLA